MNYVYVVAAMSLCALEITAKSDIKSAKKQEKQLTHVEYLLQQLEEHKQQNNIPLIEEFTVGTLAEAARHADHPTVKKMLKEPFFQQPTIESMGALARAQSLARGSTDKTLKKSHKKIINALQDKITELQKKSERSPRQSPVLR